MNPVLGTHVAADRPRVWTHTGEVTTHVTALRQPSARSSPRLKQGSAKSREQRPKQSVYHMRRLEAEAHRSASQGSLTWQLGGRNVLPILVGQLSEASQAAAVTQHGVPRDSGIWKVHGLVRARPGSRPTSCFPRRTDVALQTSGDRRTDP